MRSEYVLKVDSVKEHREELLFVWFACDPKSFAMMTVEHELSITGLAHLGDVFDPRPVFRAVQIKSMQGNLLPLTKLRDDDGARSVSLQFLDAYPEAPGEPFNITVAYLPGRLQLEQFVHNIRLCYVEKLSPNVNSGWD